jgi:23S rRNA (adenine2030-N6)-methyltransferase
MLSYRHGFHAGNFADVHKHLVLALVLEWLGHKETPFFVLDSHAGAGSYDLGSAQALKVREHEQGIARLWPATKEGPLPRLYRDALRTENPGAELRRYPGSPAIIRNGLREQDRAALVELHPADLAALRTFAAESPRLGVHGRDGFEALGALLPPRERRGLVLVDPPYELKDDYGRVVSVLLGAYRKWPTGIFVLWYPLLPEARERTMLAEIERSGIRKVLLSELLMHRRGRERGMHGSGILVFNPPWALTAELDTRLPAVLARLAPERGEIHQRWLVPE